MRRSLTLPSRRRAVAIALALLGVLALPALARADAPWHPELSHRPRMALDGRDTAHIARIRDRIARGDEPWASAYRAVRDAAEHGQTVDYRTSGWENQPDHWAVLYGQEVSNGLVARSLALVGYLYTQGVDPAWRPVPRNPGEATADGWVRDAARRARDIIDRMYEDWPCYRGSDCVNRGIVMAESLLVHCQAYDLLAALPATFRPDLAGPRGHLSELASDARFWGWTVDIQDNNHGIRVHSGLGAAAICLNDLDVYRWWRPSTWWSRPSGWMEEAERELGIASDSSDLYIQAESGAYAEGTSYMEYSSSLYLPFFFAYDRFLSGGGTPWMRSDLVSRLERWEIQIALPDGRRPAVDNARMGQPFDPGMFVNRFAGGARDDADRLLFGWDFLRNGAPGMTGSRAYELLSAFDPDPALEAQIRAQTAPALPPTAFLDGEGEAVLRTGWGTDAAYALVLAEHGSARTAGGGHEDADAGSFTFFAGGDIVVLDPGYGGWPIHEQTHAASDHSLVLIDGRGPPTSSHPFWALDWISGGVDAFIVPGDRTFEAREVRSVAVRSSYESADIDRTVVLGGDRWLAVEDDVRCRTPGGIFGSLWSFLFPPRPRTIETVLQLDAGGQKAYPLVPRPDGASFRTHRVGVPVEVVVAAAGQVPALRFETNEDYLGGPEGPSGHGVLRAGVSGRRARLLAVVATAPAGAAPPDVATVPVGGDAAAIRILEGATGDVLLTNPGRMAVRVGGIPGVGAFETDASFAIVSFRMPSTIPAWYVLQDATYFAVDTVGGRLSVARPARGPIRLTDGVSVPSPLR